MTDLSTTCHLLDGRKTFGTNYRSARKPAMAHPQPGWLIHSNERVGVHDVTTFHGPPFASVRDKPWWKKVSIRVAMQLWMERRELRVARAIVPGVVSDLCGAAAQVTEGRGEVISLQASASEWAAAVERQLARNEPPPGFVRGWEVVASEFVAVYERIRS